MFAFSGHKGRFRCKVPQELEAIFYGNYLVPALVNSVNPEIVNDMKTEYMNDLPYPNDLLQEVDRWVAKCICCNLQFVNTLTYSISYADADMYPNIHVILKLLLTLPAGFCTRGRSFSALRHLKTKTEDRLCGMAMLHLHRNDTYRQVNPDAVIKRWDSSGSMKIHLAFTD